ncbi:FHA domain-containing protein [Mycena indigotica]|uniref:FHA domain-containing protein n=1 Tax=Mycena indigotica TaxID=2126181 RepID=A0A8H6SHP0_9AGAR|nr:FHA domain-containing protein [Mycena indigotica]KAF7298871.1 FHA domain-containing protein [Mycena indigotica]
MDRRRSPPPRNYRDQEYDRQRDSGRRDGGSRRYPEERDRESNRRRREDEQYGYSERERERERNRDRDRYESSSRRRSASPRRRGSRSLSPRSKAKPDFKASGLLAAETNTVRAANGDSTVLKYNEPPEARKPIVGWRLYVFKGEEQVELLHIHRQSAYLIGRDRIVADISVDHPSCSKQHAVIQYRFIQQKDEFGTSKGVIKPFIIDLESTNGTFVNGSAIPVSRYYELKASDVIKFGTSTREYVLLHDEAS